MTQGSDTRLTRASGQPWGACQRHTSRLGSCPFVVSWRHYLCVARGTVCGRGPGRSATGVSRPATKSSGPSPRSSWVGVYIIGNMKPPGSLCARANRPHGSAAGGRAPYGRSTRSVGPDVRPDSRKPVIERLSCLGRVPPAGGSSVAPTRLRACCREAGSPRGSPGVGRVVVRGGARELPPAPEKTRARGPGWL